MRGQPLLVVVLEVLGIIALILWILASLGHPVRF
jgi:hypothetical protein